MDEPFVETPIVETPPVQVLVSPPPPAEVPPPVPTSVVKEKKEPILFYILAGILIVAGLAFSAYNFMQKKNSQIAPATVPTSISKPTESIPTPTPDPTANWKVYSNAKYSYSLKYPSEWEQLETNNGNYVRFFKGTYSPNLPLTETYISILGKANPIQKPLQEWLKVEGILPSQEDTHSYVSNFMVNGIRGIKISTPVNGGQDTIYLPIKNSVLQITYIFKEGNLDKYGALVNTFNQILSTFKFLN